MRRGEGALAAGGLVRPGRATPVKALAGLEASSQFCGKPDWN